MAYCPYCGAQVHDKAVICVSCQRQIGKIKNNILGIDIIDEGGILWGLFGFMLPLLGLLMFLLMKKDYPQNATAAGVGALIAFGIGFTAFFGYITIFFTTFFIAY